MKPTRDALGSSRVRHAQCVTREVSAHAWCRCEEGILKAWELERRRVCAGFQATGQGFGILRIDTLGEDKIVSQARDGVIRLWDAQSLNYASSSTSHQAAPEPLREIATGAFHFCQFALTRWRGSVARSREPDALAVGICGASSGPVQQNDIRHALDPCDMHEDEDTRMQYIPGPHSVIQERASVRACNVPIRRGGIAEATSANGSSAGPFTENTMITPCEEQHSVRLWDIRDKAPAYTIVPRKTKRRGMVMCVRLFGEAASTAAPFAACGHDSGHLCFYDLRATSAEPLIVKQLHKAPLLCFDVGSSCSQGASGSANDSVNVFRINLRKASCDVLHTFTTRHPGTSCIEIRSDQKLFVTGGWDHRVRVFGWKKPRPLAVLRSHEQSVRSIAHSPRIGSFASASTDSRVALWDLYSETPT